MKNFYMKKKDIKNIFTILTSYYLKQLNKTLIKKFIENIKSY